MRAGYIGCETWAASGFEEVLLSTTYYFYNDVGNQTRVVTDTVGAQPRFSATVMEYAANGQAMTYVMGETWNNDGSGIEDYTRVYAREFRYDGGRQRYMNAVLDTTTFAPRRRSGRITTGT
jgi:hypothetical protein